MTIQERETEFRNKVNRLISFPYEVRQEFADYWTEPNKSGTKMLFELEKTWDLGRRLTRWANNGFGNKTYGSGKAAVNRPEMAVVASQVKEIQELDSLLSRYKLHPTEVPFSELGKFYDYLKKEKLLKGLYPSQIESLKQSYKNDNYKCRCACVQMTFDGYVNSGITFSDIMNMRNKLNVS